VLLLLQLVADSLNIDVFVIKLAIHRLSQSHADALMANDD
jgi:hypothetical protein